MSAQQMKHFVKRLLKNCGVFACRSSVLPAGIDLGRDLRSLGIQPATILDIGANRGQTVDRFKYLWPSAVIHAFEPFPAAFTQLETTCRRHRTVQAVNAACGALPATLSVPELPGSETNSLVRPAGEASKCVSVRVTTVDQYCADTGISEVDLLKTDTEGYELEVLRGAAAMLSRAQIRAVLVETAFDRKSSEYVHFEDLLKFLSPYGMRLVMFYDVCLNGKGWHFGNALFARCNEQSQNARAQRQVMSFDA